MIGCIQLHRLQPQNPKYGTPVAQTSFATATSQPGLVVSPPPVSGVSQVGAPHLPRGGFHALGWDLA